MESKYEKVIYAGTGIVIAALFSLAFLGIAGFRTVMGFAIFVFMPFYLILDSFTLKESEKIIYSITLGFILFSSFAYWLGFVISFKLGIFVIFLILVITGVLLRKFKKK